MFSNIYNGKTSRSHWIRIQKKNFRNRGVQYTIKRAGKAVSNFMGGAASQMTIQPYQRPLPKMGGVVVARHPLKFNY